MGGRSKLFTKSKNVFLTVLWAVVAFIATELVLFQSKQLGLITIILLLALPVMAINHRSDKQGNSLAASFRQRLAYALLTGFSAIGLVCYLLCRERLSSGLLVVIMLTPPVAAYLAVETYMSQKVIAKHVCLLMVHIPFVGMFLFGLGSPENVELAKFMLLTYGTGAVASYLYLINTKVDCSNSLVPSQLQNSV